MNAQDLKNSILQLAIQGKLVEQREEEGTAEELYQQIQEEKAELIKEGKIKKGKLLPATLEDEVPFGIPENWKWVRLGEIVNIKGGKRLPVGKQLTQNKTDHIYIRVTDMKNQTIDDTDLHYIDDDTFEKISNYIIEKSDIYIVIVGSTIGKVGLVPEKFHGMNLTENAARLIPICIDKDYLMRYLSAKVAQKQFIDQTNQVGQPKLALIRLANTLTPIPPLEEQKRIIAKIEKLMPYVEKYGEAHSKLEVFNKKFPEDVQKSILQYAIQGKLVEQRDEEGTAEALYQQIQEEKVKLIKEGKIKKEKPLPAITEDEIPFDIPDSWKWVRIPEMSYFQEGPGILAVDFRDSGVPLIRISGMQNEDLSLEGCNYLDPDMVEKRWSHYKLDLGDIVISTSASMDKICEVTDKTVGSIPYTGQIRFKMYGNINKDYFRFFIKSSCYIKQINEQKSGGTIKHYGPTHLKKMIIPLPPLEEQKRIVAKIEELMPFSQQLAK